MTEQIREDYQTRRRAEILEKLSEREISLIREVAVAAWVRAERYAGLTHSSDYKAPTDEDAFNMAIDTAIKFPDLYPNLTGFEESTSEE